MFTAAAACAVVVPLMAVGVIVDTVTGDPPNEAVTPLWNPVPAIVTEVPPAAGPLVGATDVTVGAATYMKQPLHVPAWASGFVTTTFTAPAVCDVVVPVMLVSAMLDTVSAELPNDTVAPGANPVPVIVTDVPPAAAPLLGVTEATVGAGTTYVKQPLHAPLCASGLVTITFTAPCACAVVFPVIAVGLIVETVRADPPNETLAPATKPLPAIVTAVPLRVDPLAGVTELTVGAATYVKQPLHVALCVSGFVTVTFTAPAEWAVVVPVMLVALIVDTESADPPRDAVAPV